MAILLTLIGILFAVKLVLGIINNKDDNHDLSYLEDC